MREVVDSFRENLPNVEALTLEKIGRTAGEGNLPLWKTIFYAVIEVKQGAEIEVERSGKIEL